MILSSFSLHATPPFARGKSDNQQSNCDNVRGSGDETIGRTCKMSDDAMPRHDFDDVLIIAPRRAIVLAARDTPPSARGKLDNK
jgi:hypothetical protein